MSNIHQALGYLFKKIEMLEATALKHEQGLKEKARATPASKGKAGAPDLFGAPSKDQAALARKLDSAIAKVEQVLQEGQA